MTTTVDYHKPNGAGIFWNWWMVKLSGGEMEEAGNKLWGAAAHAIKAVAEKARMASRGTPGLGGNAVMRLDR